jgi:hypothetical protein
VFQIIKGAEIRSVEDWFRLAPPKKGACQWADGRSAKELARAWFPTPGDPQMPVELTSLLQSQPEAQGCTFDTAEPERLTCFDRCGGEPRNADLVLWGQNNNGKVLLSLEAKADEPFGSIAGEYSRSAREHNRRSRLPERIELLCRGVLGVEPDDGEASLLRYQLLTAVAGTLVEGQKYDAKIVVLVIHEFVGKTDEDKLRGNAADLNRFIKLLSRGGCEGVTIGALAGPFHVPGNEYFRGTDRFFVGKCQRRVVV